MDGQQVLHQIALTLFLLLSPVQHVLSEDDSPLCTDPVCYFEWDVRWDRSLTYRDGLNTYNVAYDTTDDTLRIIPNIFRENDPLIGTEVPYDRVHTADGYPRDIIVINGRFPGPVLKVMEGSQVEVRVTNHLDTATSIHFHGMRQYENNNGDGIPYVTQCPINPGQTYTYRFTAIPYGTHWYHSHFSAQRVDGFSGMLIVYRKKPEYEEHMMQFSDWGHVTSNTLLVTDPYDWDWPGTGEYDALERHSEALIIYGTQNDNPEPQTRPLQYNPDNRVGDGTESARTNYPNPAAAETDADADSGDILRGDAFSPYTPYSSEYATTFLLNGRGRGDDTPLPLTIYNVRPGGKNRFRAVHTGSTPGIKISVDQHKLRMVAVDGRDIHPVVVDSFFVAPGERFDFELDADQPIERYWVRVWVQSRDVVPSDMGQAGILTYFLDDEEMINPTTLPRQCTLSDPCVAFNCIPGTLHKYSTTCVDMQSVVFDTIEGLDRDIYVPSEEDDYLEYFLNFGLLHGPTINSIKNIDPGAIREPDGLTYTPCLAEECDDEPCTCTHMLEIPVGRKIQLVLSNLDTHQGTSIFGHHSIHLHGHGFYVMYQGYPTFNRTTDDVWMASMDIDCGNVMCKEAKWRHEPEYNYNWPAVKDTVVIPAMGYTVIRFLSDNPGYWLLHCHVMAHHVGGMGLILMASSDEESYTADDLPECGVDAFMNMAAPSSSVVETDSSEATGNESPYIVIQQTTCDVSDADVVMTKTAFAFSIIACLLAGIALAAAFIYFYLQHVTARRFGEDANYRPLLKNED